MDNYTSPIAYCEYIQSLFRKAAVLLRLDYLSETYCLPGEHSHKTFVAITELIRNLTRSHPLSREVDTGTEFAMSYGREVAEEVANSARVVSFNPRKCTFKVYDRISGQPFGPMKRWDRLADSNYLFVVHSDGGFEEF